MESNIYNDFKKTIGYANATNQCVELQNRYFHNEFLSKTPSANDIDNLSKQYNLNVSRLYNSNEFTTRISNFYIINTHGSFACFLEQFQKLDGFPYEKKTDNKVDLLTWIITSIYPCKSDRPEDVHMWYCICNYYRLVRNSLVHSEKSSHERDVLYSKLSYQFTNTEAWKSFKGDLSAPNTNMQLCFDDQVLYSKAAIKLSKHIFYSTKYDLFQHALKNKSIIDKLTRKYDKNPTRRISILKSYFSKIYPIKQHDYENDLQRIVLEL